MAKFTCNFISYILRRAVDITVIIPSPTIPESTRRATAEKPCTHTPETPYPVLYLLHGMGNNHATWTGYTNVELFAEERQIAIVNFSAENKGYITYGRDDYFRFVSEELPDFVGGMFPISKRPEDTFLAGLSMGGYGTLVHGLTFPERFAAIGTFSGAVSLPPEFLSEALERLDSAAQNSILQKGSSETTPCFDPRSLVDKLLREGRKLPKLYMACGNKDFLYQSNLDFREHLYSAGVDLTWEELEGYGHEWRFWNIEIERFLDWIPRTDYYSTLDKRKV